MGEALVLTGLSDKNDMISGMNLSFFTLILATLTAGPVTFAAEVSKEASKSEVYGDVRQDETLQKMLEIPAVEKFYKECDKDFLTQKEKIPGCLWEKVKADSALKKQVETIYAESAKKKDASGAGRAPASTDKKESLTGRRVNVGKDYNSDPTVKALSDFFGTKLAEVFQTTDAELKDKKIKSVDHEDYIKLYKSELGKSIVNVLTSYCLGTDDSDMDCRTKGICKYDEDNKAANIASLKTMNLGDDSSKERWKACIGGIPKVCYENAANDSESKYQACLVMDFVKSARKNIIIADKQKEFYDQLRKDTANGVTAVVSNMVVADENKRAADNLTSITSADITKGKIADTNEALKKEAEECLGNSGIKDPEKCKKFLSEKKEENEKAVAEFGLGQEIQAEMLDEKLKDDKNVAAYLEEEGYDKKQIEEMTSKDNITKVREEIKERFAAEKEAIIKSMSKKILDKTVNDPKDPNANISKLSSIKKEFSERTKELGQLVQFTNIVSGYLEVDGEKDGKKVTSRNTASVFAEVESMENQQDKNRMLDSLKKADLKKDSNTTQFNVREINEVIRYKVQPKQEDKK